MKSLTRIDTRYIVVNRGFIGKGFKGKIAVYENDTFLWSDTSETERLNIQDAMFDAEKMKTDLLEENNIKELAL